MELWIARTKWNNLLLFVDKPIKRENAYWVDNVGLDNYVEIPSCYYPEVTFENSPQEVELVIKK